MHIVYLLHIIMKVNILHKYDGLSFVLMFHAINGLCSLKLWVSKANFVLFSFYFIYKFLTVKIELKNKLICFSNILTDKAKKVIGFHLHSHLKKSAEVTLSTFCCDIKLYCHKFQVKRIFCFCEVYSLLAIQIPCEYVTFSLNQNAIALYAST